MAKILKYKLLVYVNHEIGSVFNNVCMDWNEANEEIAKREAYNGEYTIEDDGLPDVVSAQDDIDNMLVDHEYRLTMLELEI